MIISRREFMRYCVAVAGAMGLTASGLIKLQEALAAEDGPPVVWLQGQGCTGCSVSLLNSIYYMTAADLLLSTIDLEFHATVMAGAGDLAVSAAEEPYANEGFVLVVEGAIPCCREWGVLPPVAGHDGAGGDRNLQQKRGLYSGRGHLRGLWWVDCRQAQSNRGSGCQGCCLITNR